jgi:hypothetical protein
VRRQIPETSKALVERLKWWVFFYGLQTFLVHQVSVRAETKPEKIYRKILPSVMTLEVENEVGGTLGSGVLRWPMISLSPPGV